jgi:hypothetical protein
MTDWNLQAAIGAYYDFESPSISDITIEEGESITPILNF